MLNSRVVWAHIIFAWINLLYNLVNIKKVVIFASLSWKQSFYLKKLIPIEDIERLPVKATALLFYGHATLNSQLNKLFIKHNNTQLTVRIHILLGLKPCCAQFATWQIYNPLQNRSLTPNRSLDRNVLISIILLLLLAVLCPSAAVFYSVPSRRSPLRLRQNGR